MKVLVIGAPPLTMSKQCAIAFQREECETKHVNYRFLQGHRFAWTNKLINKHIISVAEHFRPELVLVVKGEKLLPGTILAIKKTGAFTINWVIDEPTGKYHPEGKLSNLHEYDHVVCFDNSYLPLLLQLGAPAAEFLPIGVDETVYTEKIPLAERTYSTDICFLGTYTPEREKMFTAIAEKNLVIYGPNWKKKIAQHSPLASKLSSTTIKGPDACMYFNQKKININQTHSQAQDGGINLRIPEILATKSFLLTNNFKGLSALFELGKELATYDSPEDFKQKIEYYLAHPEERDAIATAGYERILKEHTFRHRIRKLINIFLTATQKK